MVSVVTALPVTGVVSVAVIALAAMLMVATGIHGVADTAQRQRCKRVHRHRGVRRQCRPTQLRHHGRTIKP